MPLTYIDSSFDDHHSCNPITISPPSQSVAVVNVPEPLTVTPIESLFDLFGRIRVSSPETQVQIKQDTAIIRDLTLSHGFVVPNVNMTTEYVSSYTDIISTGTGGHYRARSKLSGLYQNGKSILILFTFNAVTNGTAGVIKRGGYYNGGNGIWLEQNGTEISWNKGSTLDGGSVGSVPQSAWANQDLVLDWTKAQIGYIAFEYLGVGDIVVGFVQDRQINQVHVFSHKNGLNIPYMKTPNLYLTYEMIVNRVTTHEERFRFICASCLIEGGQERSGFPFSLSRFTGFNIPLNTPTAILVFRLVQPNQRVLINNYEVAFGANATIKLDLMKLDSAGVLPSSSGVVNGVEHWLPTSSSVTFSGVSLSSTLATQSTRQGSATFLVNQYLEMDFNDNGVYYALVVTSNVNNLALQSALVNLILEY